MDKYTKSYSDRMRSREKEERDARLDVFRAKQEQAKLRRQAEVEQAKLEAMKILWDFEQVYKQRERADRERKRHQEAIQRETESVQRQQDAVQSYDDALQAQSIMDQLTRKT